MLVCCWICIYIYIDIYIYIYHTGDGVRRVTRERDEETSDEEISDEESSDEETSDEENKQLRRQLALVEAETCQLREMLGTRQRAPSLAKVCHMARNSQWQESAGWGWGAAHMC